MTLPDEYKKYSIEKEIFSKCPICKKGRVNLLATKGFRNFILGKDEIIICNNCCAIFNDEGKDHNDEELFSLNLSESKEKNKYNEQTLLRSEWEKGISELDYCVKTNTLINLNIEDLNVILEPKEITHHQTEAQFLEERAVRQNYGGAVRVMKGVYVGGSRGESYGELRVLDEGALLLTSKRLLFNGDLRSCEYRLNKIISVEEYKEAVEIGLSNKKKVQVFAVDDAHKLATYIRMAIKKTK